LNSLLDPTSFEFLVSLLQPLQFDYLENDLETVL
jgi:hypothetical protein